MNAVQTGRENLPAAFDQVSHQRFHFKVAERLEEDRAGRPAALQHRDRLTYGTGRHLVGPVRHAQNEPLGADVLARETQEIPRAFVRPLQIVDDQQQRRFAGRGAQRSREDFEATALARAREIRLVAVRRHAGIAKCFEQRRERSRRVFQTPPDSGARFARARVSDEFGGEPAFAEAAFAGDQHDRTVREQRVLERGAQGIELLPATDEAARRGSAHRYEPIASRAQTATRKASFVAGVTPATFSTRIRV